MVGVGGSPKYVIYFLAADAAAAAAAVAVMLVPNSDETIAILALGSFLLSELC